MGVCVPHISQSLLLVVRNLVVEKYALFSLPRPLAAVAHSDGTSSSTDMRHPPKHPKKYSGAQTELLLSY
ncbi:hypothetical protein BO83DRAFT_379298 [Aspergillus eucalypticola CBS 122712]|uniref:Uncharacterized protein n=1 Tax=Aspergillus eucalypticola (strain CBS 122712 / IBT 29274) TaxID=1448314 RepID=A0A317V8S1_ASPEC|nr:uncharacterized protein BO83DRAFT_379298 [Aspergillus eucalypticola CBS 122712]PWY70546.1 hypothetical protein BO83DRAFT_379298 [Aspergillus eucalypticola CBS 122712]